MSNNEQIKDFSESADFATLVSHLKNFPFSEFSSRDLRKLNRQLKSVSGKPEPQKIAFLGNVTLDMLPSAMNLPLAQLGMLGDYHVVDINQHYQAIYSETSELVKFKPDYSILILSMRELNPQFCEQFSNLSVQQRKACFQDITRHIQEWVDAALEKLTGNIILTNFPLPGFSASGLADVRDTESEWKYYSELNQYLIELTQSSNRIQLLDLQQLVNRVGTGQAYDTKMYYLAKIEWTESFAQTVTSQIAKLIFASKGMSKKCLVLDLDNTLWGGIIGEDGPQGVNVGKGNPVGEAFYDFQHRILNLKARGILLAICSKNNLSDVEETFKLRSEMPLSLDDFTVIMANWEHKQANIAAIAQQLNIGLDSLVFIDDNPVEVNMVREMLPEVVSLLLPDVPETMSSFIADLPWFEKTVLLEDDRNKAEQYKQNSQREQMKAQSGGLESYLHSLETIVTLRFPEAGDSARIYQLFTKTNQFNATTIRYSQEDVDSFISDETVDLHIFSVKDRFGDLGIVGLVLIRQVEDENKTLGGDIDSFIMSCRSMGRGVEKAVLNTLKTYYFEEKGYAFLTSSYRPTKKNLPIKTVYTEAGFTTISTSEEGDYYRLASADMSLQEADWITVEKK